MYFYIIALVYIMKVNVKKININIKYSNSKLLSSELKTYCKQYNININVDTAIRIIKQEYNNYCQTYLSSFLRHVGFNKKLTLNIIFMNKVFKKGPLNVTSSMAYVDPTQLSDALINNKPFEINIRVSETINDIVPFLWKEDNNLRGIIRYILTNLIHETVHIGQFISKTTPLRQKNVQNYKETNMFKKNMQINIIIFNTFLQYLENSIMDINNFINDCKTEGEAKYFEYLVTNFILPKKYGKVPNKVAFENLIRNIKKDEVDIDLEDINYSLKGCISDAKSDLESLSDIYKIYERIIINTKKAYLAEQKGIDLTKINKILNYESRQFSHVISQLKKKKKFSYADTHLQYTAGRMVVYVLKRLKKFRYTLSPKTMFELFIKYANDSEFRTIRVRFEQLIHILNKYEEFARKFESQLPNSEKELKYFISKISNI
jgi:hypothetical protein